MRPEKASIQNEIKQKVEKSTFIFLADYHGMKVEDMDALRKRLRGTSAQFQVVKNVFLKHVAEEHGWKEIIGSLETPTAIVLGVGEITDAAKVLKVFASERSLPVVKGGMLGDRYLSADDIKELALILPRIQLLGMLAGALVAPIVGLVRVMSGGLASLPIVLHAVAEKKTTAEIKE